MERDKVKEAITKAKESSKQRKFVQTLDLAINFRDVDFNKPEDRLNLDVVLPNGFGKDIKIGVFADKELMAEARENASVVIPKEELESLQQNTNKTKKLAKDCMYFLAQASLMPNIGKSLGQILAPRGKMPSPVPPNAKLKPIVERLKKTVKIKNKGKFLPTIHVAVGAESQGIDQLTDNAMAVLNSIRDKMQKGRISSVSLKLTMGPSVKVEA